MYSKVPNKRQLVNTGKYKNLDLHVEFASSSPACRCACYLRVSALSRTRKIGSCLVLLHTSNCGHRQHLCWSLTTDQSHAWSTTSCSQHNSTMDGLDVLIAAATSSTGAPPSNNSSTPVPVHAALTPAKRTLSDMTHTMTAPSAKRRHARWADDKASNRGTRQDYSSRIYETSR